MKNPFHSYTEKRREVKELIVNIIACIKYVPERVESSETTQTIKRDAILGRINPLDLNAIEEALRIKEKKQAHTIGLCMGVEAAADTIDYGIAMGLDEVVLLSDPVFAGSDTYVTAYIISMAIRSIGIPDLVFCGNQSADGSTGQVPQELAVHLGLPCIINVVSIQLADEKVAKCIVATENGNCCVDVELPAVIGLLKEVNEPRIPSISGLLRAKRKPVVKLNSKDIMVNEDDCGLSASCTEIRAIRYYKRKEKKTITMSSTTYLETMDMLVAYAHSDMLSLIESPYTRLQDAANANNQTKEIWIICEKDGENISETAFQLLSKALSISPRSYVVCAVILDLCRPESIEHLADFGVDKIYKSNAIESNCIFDENRLARLIHSCKQYRPSIILFENSTQGRWLSATLAACLHTGLTADCVDLRINSQTGELIQTRVAFSGNVIADVVCPKNYPQMATVRNNVFEAIPFSRNKALSVINIESVTVEHKRIATSNTMLKQPTVRRLRYSNIIICGGRGLGGKKEFDLLEQLADLIGASVGATRAAVDSKWIDYGHQIGQTGLTVKPKVYIAFGVSGAIEHIVGMDRAEYVVSVNTDDNAPINKISDYFIKGDCRIVLNNMIKYFIAKRKDV